MKPAKPSKPAMMVKKLAYMTSLPATTMNLRKSHVKMRANIDTHSDLEKNEKIHLIDIPN